MGIDEMDTIIYNEFAKEFEVDCGTAEVISNTFGLYEELKRRYIYEETEVNRELI